MNRRDLQLRLLLARCELDRREFRGKVEALRDGWRNRVDSVRKAAPWMLLLAPVLALAAVRMMRGKRWVGLLALAKVAFQCRQWLPHLSTLLRSKGPPPEPYSSRYSSRYWSSRDEPY